MKSRRTFLKRCDYPSVSISQLFVGSIITVYSRQLKVVEYADAFTKREFEKTSQATVAMVMPEALPDLGKIVDNVLRVGFMISEMKLTQGAVAMKLKAEDAVGKWQALIDGKSGVSGSSDSAAAEMEAEQCFGAGAPKPMLAHPEQSTLLLVRPHAIVDGVLGQIVDQVLACGFTVGNLQMMQMTRPNAQEFLEVYKGVVPEYADWVEELTSGKCVVMQLLLAENPVLALRELCGAHDPEIASHLQARAVTACAAPVGSSTRALPRARATHATRSTARLVQPPNHQLTFPVPPPRCSPPRCARALARARSRTPCTAPTCPRTGRSRSTTSLAFCSSREAPTHCVAPARALACRGGRDGMLGPESACHVPGTANEKEGLVPLKM